MGLKIFGWRLARFVRVPMRMPVPINGSTGWRANRAVDEAAATDHGCGCGCEEVGGPCAPGVLWTLWTVSLEHPKDFQEF